MFIVYAPDMGYSLSMDTGKAFKFETQAIAMVKRLCKQGVHAWLEFEPR